MKCVIADSRICREAEYNLMRLGYRVITLPPLDALPAPIASHPDTLLFYNNRKLITSALLVDAAPYVFTDLREYAPKIILSFTSDVYGKEYPADCVMNASVVGRRLYCRTGSISQAILDYARETGLEVVDSRQGYAACATLKLSDDSVITADPGLAECYRSHGVRVTEIEAGGISLPPYGYGFIGGASGVADGRVYFLGELSTHPSCELIERAVREAGLTPISLCRGELCDLGGLIFPG